LEKGENSPDIKPAQLMAELAESINLVEIELSVRSGLCPR